MLEGILIALGPMCLGYLIKTRNLKLLQHINLIVMILLYIILFIMGYSLGQLDDLANKLPVIALSALIFIIAIQGANLIGLLAYDKLVPRPLKALNHLMPLRWKLLLDSFKLCAMVIIGFGVGLATKGMINLPLNASTYVLVALIFFVGIQLRNNGISLREVFFNRRGIYTAIIVIISSLIGGILAALLLGLPLTQGLAIASGFGWYSLSSVILNDTWGAMFGSIAFFNDLCREIMSLFIVPFFMQHYRSTAVGITGATALDCTLPIIQRAGGMEVVPLAISYGFIINIVAPIFLVFFASIPI